MTRKASRIDQRSELEDTKKQENLDEDEEVVVGDIDQDDLPDLLIIFQEKREDFDQYKWFIKQILKQDHEPVFTEKDLNHINMRDDKTCLES